MKCRLNIQICRRDLMISRKIFELEHYLACFVCLPRPRPGECRLNAEMAAAYRRGLRLTLFLFDSGVECPARIIIVLHADAQCAAHKSPV
jgi:hypothetical protein